MAQSGRDIKRRMQTVKNTQQITKAMEMIAAAKLRKAQQRVERSRPYRNQIEQSLVRALSAARSAGEEVPELVRSSDGDRVCLVVITSDRGLAGGYNANILRQAEEYLRQHDDVQLVLIGRKARDYFRRRDQAYLADYVYLGDEPLFAQAQEISQVVQEFYINDLFDKVVILFTRFVSTINHRADLQQILPLGVFDSSDYANTNQGNREQGQELSSEVQSLYWYEPSVGEVLAAMVPLYIDTVIFQALLESIASEQGSRMNAMRSASDNAGELLDALNLSFNRARQGAITTELSEIVGGAEALG